MGKQFVNKEPLTLCYCGNHRPPETPPDAGAAAWVWFARSWGQRKGEAGASVTPPPHPLNWTSFCWACVLEEGAGRMCVCLRSYLHPFKVKFPSELAPSPHPQLLGSQAAGRAGTPVPAAVGLLPSRCLGGPCSRSLASICFGDSLWPGGSAGRRAVVWVGVGAYPGRWSCPAAGRPPGPGPGPSCPPRLPQPRRWGFVCALPARTVGRKPRCAAGGHGVTAALSSVLELDSS